ncbi:bifunctional diaminohydroxyphosphoribosylaminopyrimidine deaminase/5-amino-6-(5-phosphoribosylamino)uracil reductase RibD [Lysinibacillus sp. 2017]|uniref:bifunctional diaminohydroxyphosphoribosylaminopyrimidine deaminase/5-amino-6-(5-phosphoribosylamino)uracil reductase RibD n=1 Tax=unclassified Lysinibacillus TaxID=2636778 RepID=UPI000D52825D|nr:MULTISPECIES: bifunctional diaminohydroxyphosphoribosylaminopyrimidine deaminase/5-amino-6-(5-phosphoribosylamino)uracil reductase RibD [unclassified Lysinibacillus]AWE07545.1 bifunctional diaminohydroxyphosphoribosylaminopyrimidine deaminase/5-amino-6-(5-phosphoribosylamino)uracil reductase RibD [Lysinibacillus sp. 2017]TGN36708.1 bifunctional diaminohydroxyphosphoribosylaminopyrimidine deaminase/5-amino-6-(5-phosphoribosylamino)uracil reductase RibD [Lysinibacillus sp. S2017]
MKSDNEYMKLALELAASAKGNTNPNPLVGAVIVKDGVIVGTGLHRKAGEPHAEVHAFRMAGEHAKGATLYVTLEPCSHYGKTPPCANLVKESEVARVVVAMQDPNPAVAGRGIKLLRDAGIEVKVGVLEAEAQKLNERFIHNMLTERPFVVSKFAMTLDGKIAAHNGHSQWITSEKARANVHQLRHEVDGILVGVNTVLHDNPKLTTRLPEGNGRNPIRVVLDSSLRTPLDAHISNTSEARTVIVTSLLADEQKAISLEKQGVIIIRVPLNEQGTLNIEETLKALYKVGITHLLVEGGGAVNAAFLRSGFIDQYIVYVAPKVLGGANSITPFTGCDVDSIDLAAQLVFDEVLQIGEDIRITAYPKKVRNNE